MVDTLLNKNDKDSLYQFQTINKYGIIGYDGKVLVKCEWDTIQVNNKNQINLIKRDQYLSPRISLEDSSNSILLSGFTDNTTDKYLKDMQFDTIIDLAVYKAFIIKIETSRLITNKGELLSEEYDFISKEKAGRFFFAVNKSESIIDSNYQYMAFLLDEKGKSEYGSSPMKYQDSFYSIDFILTKRKCYSSSHAININYYPKVDSISYKYFEEPGNNKSFSKGFNSFSNLSETKRLVDHGLYYSLDYSSNDCFGLTYFIGWLIAGLFNIIFWWVLFLFSRNFIGKLISALLIIPIIIGIIEMIIPLIRVIFRLF